ncbi:MAG TPA: outer membrane protein [Pseudolabrys sp.]|nr:outer membrane protein [Pseudolabrys sp.]
MNRFIINVAACVLAFAMAMPSFAADMPGQYREPAYVSPPFSWSGFYVGLNAGYGWGTSNWTSSVTAGSTSPAGAMFGGTFGFNAQSGAFVFGVEGDASGNWMRDSNSIGSGICTAPGCGIQTSWFATARGRVGYAFDRALFYATAGGAFGDVQMQVAGLTATADRAGWTAGVGLEYELLGPWSAKVEYLYANLGTASCGAATCGIDTSVNFKTSIIRLGVNYRFW